MRKLFLGISALALICIAGFVTAQASPQDQTPPSSDKTSAEATASTAAQPDQGTKLRLARMDTSVAAFRKLDTDNDGRISALEAAAYHPTSSLARSAPSPAGHRWVPTRDPHWDLTHQHRTDARSLHPSPRIPPCSDNRPCPYHPG